MSKLIYQDDDPSDDMVPLVSSSQRGSRVPFALGGDADVRGKFRGNGVSVWSRCGDALDLCRNLKPIFQRPQHRLACLDGLRALGFLWSSLIVVALGLHAFGPDSTNLDTAAESLNAYAGSSMILAALLNFEAPLQLFLVLCGFLAAWQLLTQTQGGATSTGLHVLYRFMRICPTVIACCLVMMAQRGWPVLMSRETESGLRSLTEGCSTNAVFTMLMVNNLVASSGNETAVGCPAWEVAVPTMLQLSLVAPMILACFVMLRLGWAAKGFLLAVAAGGLTLRAFLVLLSWSGDNMLHLLDNPALQARFVASVLGPSYMHVAAFALGMFAGAVVSEWAQVDKSVSLADANAEDVTLSDCTMAEFARSVAVLVAVLALLWMHPLPWGGLAGLDQLLGGRGILLTLGAIGHGTSFAVVVTVGLVMCLTERARFLNAFLSSKFWFPLSALSFPAFLLQLCLLPYLVVHFGTFAEESLLKFFGVVWPLSVLCSLGLALLVSLLVERPCINLARREQEADVESWLPGQETDA